MVSLPRIAAAGMLLGLLLAGCAGNGGLDPDRGLDPDGAFGPDGALDPDGGEAGTKPTDLERAVEAVGDAATYISFDYSANGCNDRSILIAAELAAAGIPSNAQFIVASGEDGSNMLRPRQYPDLEWHYHVAPVIFVSESEAPTDNRKFLTIRDGEVVGDIDSGAYIVDPALYPEQIVAPLETWVDDLTGHRQNAFLSLADAREALDTPSDEAQAIERVSETNIPTTMEDMPKLWQFQLSGSCGFLSRDAQQLEGELGAEAIGDIRRNMNAGVLSLLEEMLRQDLLLKTRPIPIYPCWDF